MEYQADVVLKVKMPPVTKKILVIDDEIDIREIARISLEISKGWNVITATSGEEGIEIAMKEEPAAILLDVTMPKMNGLEVLEKLKSLSGTVNIPVILLTAHVQAVKDPELIRLGAKAVFIKPFDPVLLARQVEEALGW